MSRVWRDCTSVWWFLLAVVAITVICLVQFVERRIWVQALFIGAAVVYGWMGLVYLSKRLWG